MRLYVKSLGGIIPLDVLPTHTIGDLKLMIEEREPMFIVLKQRLLVADSEELNDNDTVGALGFHNEQEIFLLMIENYCAPQPDRMIQMIHEYTQPFAQRFVSSDERDELRRNFLQRLGLTRGQRWTFRLKHHTDNRFKNVWNNHIRCSLPNYEVALEPIDDNMEVVGTIYDFFLGSDDRTNKHLLWLILTPPFSLENQNINRICISYSNLVTCDQFLGNKRSRKRSQKRLSKKIQKYIRRSLKKAMRRFIK